MPVIDAAACHYTTWNASRNSAGPPVVAIGAGCPPEISAGTQIALAPPGGCDTRSRSHHAPRDEPGLITRSVIATKSVGSRHAPHDELGLITRSVIATKSVGSRHAPHDEPGLITRSVIATKCD